MLNEYHQSAAAASRVRVGGSGLLVYRIRENIGWKLDASKISLGQEGQTNARERVAL